MIMDIFKQQKSSMLEKLYKPDNSKKGDVDQKIIPLIDLINKTENYYTTSSCAGRICLFVEPDSWKKDEAEWHFVTHELTSWDEIKEYLENLPDATIWFRMEGAIIHVVARTEGDANKFLETCRSSGFKRSGMISTSKRIVIEAVDSHRIDVPIAVKGDLIVQENFIKFLIKKANKQLEETWKGIDKLFIGIQELE